MVFQALTNALGLDIYVNVNYYKDMEMESAQDKHDWTTRRLAQASGLSTARIRQLLIVGRDLHGRKVGRDWLVSDAEARRWLATLEVKP